MKVKIPKSYKQLSHTDQQELKKFTQDVALEAAEAMLEKDARVMLDIYMKMTCLVLHDAFGSVRRDCGSISAITSGFSAVR